MFEKGAGFQVMVEYPDVPTAVTARDGLDNQHMYEGCNILRIGFSNLSTITVVSWLRGQLVVSLA